VGLAAYDTVISDYVAENICKKQLFPILENHSRPANKIRILTVDTLYNSRSFSEATILLEGLNKILNEKDDLEIFVFTILSSDVVPEDSIRRYEVDGVSVFGVNFSQRNDRIFDYDNFFIVDAFENTLMAVKPDLVHFHHIQEIGVAVTDVCNARGIPYIVTLHNSWWLNREVVKANQHGKYSYRFENDASQISYSGEDIGLSNYKRTRLRSVLKTSKLLLSSSQFIADYYIRNGFSASEILVNRSGIQQSGGIRKYRYKGPLTFGYILNSGQVGGDGDLIKEVFANLTVNFVVIYNEYHLNSPILDNDFLKMGWTKGIPIYTKNTIESFFSRIDILLFPRQWEESFDLIIQEALVRNVWVIATDPGSAVEYILSGRNGFVVPFDDDGGGIRSAVVDTINYYQRFQVGDEICLEKAQIQWLEDQAEELAMIYKRITDQNI
jgi:O-antigen biosynthesis protein